MNRNDYIAAYSATVLILTIAIFSYYFPVIQNNIDVTMLLGTTLIVSLLII